MTHRDPIPPIRTIFPPKTGLAADPLNIVILGASYAGLACAHAFLDDTINHLRQTPGSPHYRLIVISPSTHFYWNVAAPRLLVAPDLVQQDDAFISIESGFHRHRGHQFSIIQGECMILDPEMRTVTVELASAEAQKRMNVVTKRASMSPVSPTRLKIQSFTYHALILATGSSTHSDLLSLHGPHIGTVGALNTFHARVDAANTIVVAGGGCSGVECAGQLATYLNHSSRWPYRRKKKSAARKQIILLTGTHRCLPSLSPKLGARAEQKLSKLGVQVRHDIRVSAVHEEFDLTGQTKLDLDNDTSLITDVYLPCTGVEPNSSYAPGYVLDGRGYVKTNPRTLRVRHLPPDARVYALGDVASSSGNCVGDVYAAVPGVMRSLLRDLLDYEKAKLVDSPVIEGPQEGSEGDAGLEMPEVEVEEVKAEDVKYIPISRFGGVGCVGSKAVSSKLVWALKGKDYGVAKAKQVVIDGVLPFQRKKR